MNQFRNIQFHGTFRDYQQRVLDNADKYLKDGKINPSRYESYVTLYNEVKNLKDWQL